MNKEDLEGLRQIAVKKITTLRIISVILALIIWVIFSSFQTFLVILVFGNFIAMIFAHKDVQKFKDAYKQTIILELFKSLFDDINYIPDHGITREILDGTNMIDTGDNFYSDDYISAKYKNVSFEFSDVTIEEEYTDSDGDKHTTTIFEGQWYIFDFNKPFKADLQVCEKGFRNAKRGSFFGPNKFSKVELEDIDFNKEFNVYAQNSFDAFYVLTPGTMEKIKELNNKVNGKMLFCFINKKLHVGLHSGKNLFEPSLYKKIDIEKNHKQAKEEIQMITHFVDVLDLDNNLFRKGV